jgi:hypothetical protein
MESFKSRQFATPQANTPKQPMKLNSHTRKLYPELSSMLDLEAKQERLRKLRQSTHYMMLKKLVIKNV